MLVLFFCAADLLVYNPSIGNFSLHTIGTVTSNTSSSSRNKHDFVMRDERRLNQHSFEGIGLFSSLFRGLVAEETEKPTIQYQFQLLFSGSSLFPSTNTSHLINQVLYVGQLKPSQPVQCNSKLDDNTVRSDDLIMLNRESGVVSAYYSTLVDGQIQFVRQFQTKEKFVSNYEQVTI